MVYISRTWGVLTVSAVVGVLAGCSSSGTSSPAASDSSASSSASSTASSTPTASPSALASAHSYCAPLAAAYKVKPPTGQKTTPETLAIFGKALTPAAEAAAADGKADVAELLTLLAAMNSDARSVTAERAGTAFDSVAKLSPVVMKDCGINLMQ